MQMLNMGSQIASDTPLGKALDEIMSDMSSDASEGFGDDKEMPKMRVMRLPSLNSLFSGMRAVQHAPAMPSTMHMRFIPIQHMATQLPTTFSGPMTLPRGMSSVQIQHSNGHTTRTETSTDAEGKARPPPPANLQSISHRCYLREIAFEWELTKETMYLPLGCLQGGYEEGQDLDPVVVDRPGV